MGLFKKPQRQEFADLPDSLYFAKVAKITTKESKNKPGNMYLSWGFEIVQPPHQKRWVWANTPPTVGPKSITGKFLTELGIDISTLDPETFDEQVLLGKYVKVLVETTENKNGDKFQNVTKLMHIPDSEQPLLQSWLAQANVKGPVQVVSQQAPVFQQPVLATAPVYFPPSPVSAPQHVPVQQPVVQQPVVAPAQAPTKKFPF